MKKFVVYGSALCPDCAPCKEALEKAGAKLVYMDITESLGNLKKFLNFRDTRAEFEDIKKSGKIGIPLIVDEDKNLFFSASEALGEENGK